MVKLVETPVQPTEQPILMIFLLVREVQVLVVEVDLIASVDQVLEVALEVVQFY